MNITLLLEMAAEAVGPRIAVTCGSERLTYADLIQTARACAPRLAEGAAHIVFLGENSPAFPIALFAAAFAGRPFVPLNYRLTDPSLRSLVSRVAPASAVADGAMASRLAGLPGVILRDLDADLRSDAALVSVDEEEVAVLLFTSGTSGEPKAGLLRHRNICAYILGSVEFMSAESDEAALISVPPYHIAGISGLLSALYAGRRIVQLPGFEAQRWVEAAASERVTHAMVVPTMLGRILEVMDAQDMTLPHLRHLSYGGGQMPLSLIRRAMDRLPHVDFVNAYGLTETSSTIALLSPEDHRAARASADPKVRARLGSVGQPLPGVELEVRGENGTRQPPEAAGEIWVRGDQVSGEYVSGKALNSDGWFPTRDRGWLDVDGYLFLGGRLDDIIVRGGENISPGEIEDVLRDHPAVADAAVIGLPDEAWGERIVAAVVARDDISSAAILEWCRTRLRSTKTPETIHFRDALPYNEMGKLVRRTLKLELEATCPDPGA